MTGKRILIYGMGRCFYDSYFYDFILPELLLEDNIVEVSDKDEDKGKDTTLQFVRINEELNKYDYIIIASERFFNEIRMIFINEYDIDSSKLLSIEDISKLIYKKIFISHRFMGLNGVEIGGPSKIFELGIYDVVRSCDVVNYSDNTVWWKSTGDGFVVGEHRMGDIIIADAVDLKPIKNGTYDFCISSNILEHLANPIKSVFEAKRIVKTGGLILTVVPNKEFCFDHNREVTGFVHLLNDYRRNIDERDLSHLEEILEKHDYLMDSGIFSKEEFKERAKENFTNRCLHHHVFDENLLKNIFRFVGIRIISSGKIGNNWYIIGES